MTIGLAATYGFEAQRHDCVSVACLWNVLLMVDLVTCYATGLVYMLLKHYVDRYNIYSVHIKLTQTN